MKFVFPSSNRTPVNTVKVSVLIALFKETYAWISFRRCFSHALELATKEALQELYCIAFLHLVSIKKIVHHD